MSTVSRSAASRSRCLLLAALAAAAGCDIGGGVDPTIPAAEAELLAATLVDVTFDALFRGIGDAVAEPTEQGERPLTLTVECPAGGEVVIEGRVTGTVEAGATYEVEVVANMELHSCRRATAALDAVAAAPLSLEAGLAALNGERVGDQVIDLLGRVAWTAGADAPVECEVDLAGVHDPLGRSRIVQGAACGREVELSYPLDG